MDCTFIITSRNPGNKRVVIIREADDEIAEFKTEEEAIKEADKIPMCRAWGYEIIEIN